MSEENSAWAPRPNRYSRPAKAIVQETIAVDADADGVWIYWYQSDERDATSIRMETCLFADYVNACKEGPIKEVLKTVVPMLAGAAIQAKAKYAKEQTYASAVPKKINVEELAEELIAEVENQYGFEAMVTKLHDSAYTCAQNVINETDTTPNPQLRSALMRALFERAMKQ